MTTPPKTYWQSGQSFLLFCDINAWQIIVTEATQHFATSKFDIFETGTGGVITVEEIRHLRTHDATTPSSGQTKLIIIYHADQLNDESANTLLKVLEEPNPTSRFVLLSQTRNILPTILSRCSTWTLYESKKANEALVPLDPNAEFATVSMQIAKSVTAGRTTEVIEQWTNSLLHRSDASPDSLHWLIKIRQTLCSTQTNPRALLEATYVHLVHHYPLPTNKAFQILERDHGHL